MKIKGKVKKQIIEDLRIFSSKYYCNSNFLNAALQLEEDGIIFVQWRMTDPTRFDFKECVVFKSTNFEKAET